MKKYFLLSALLFCYVFVHAQADDFVKVDGKKFKCGQNDFWPIVMNYEIRVIHTGNLSPNPITFPYNFPTRSEINIDTYSYAAITSAAVGYSVMLRDFLDIKSKGFNTIRTGSPFGVLSEYYLGGSLEGDVSYTNTNPAVTECVLDMMENVLTAARAAGLKVIWLVDASSSAENWNHPAEYLANLSQLAQRFQYNPTLMAVDFSNEPGIHGWPITYNNTIATKTDACNITKNWNNAIKANSNILTTVGVAGGAFSPTGAWDPNVLNLDFISFHVYPVYENTVTPDMSAAIERIKSDYLWFSNNVSIPWIVGETSVSANALQTLPIDHSLDPNSTAATPAMQADYLAATIQACWDYGGAGYSWWEFMDKWDVSETMGLAPLNPVNSNTDITNLPVAWKPAAAYVAAFAPPPPSPPLTPPSCYYNYLAVNPSYSVTGTVVDQSSNPVKDACIEWNLPSYAEIGATYSRADGTFTVYLFNSVSPIPGSSYLTLSAVDCNILLPGVTMNGSVGTLTLTKIPRPTTASLAYASATVSGVAINANALTDINFTNYVINSGTFSAKAGSIVNINPGFSAVAGTSFHASIGAYYHDCGDLQSGGTPFKTAQSTSSAPVKSPANNGLVYPNPGNGMYTVNMNTEGDYSIDIFNVLGTKVKSETFRGSMHEISIRDLSDGMYTFIIKNNSGNNIQKVIKQ